MSYDLKTDDEIVTDLAQKFDLLRRTKQIKDAELVMRGGTNRVVLNNFRNSRGGISLKTFVRLIRGLGELDRLESLLDNPEQYSPSGKPSEVPAKRVRGRAGGDEPFSWEEDK